MQHCRPRGDKPPGADSPTPMYAASRWTGGDTVRRRLADGGMRRTPGDRRNWCVSSVSLLSSYWEESCQVGGVSSGRSVLWEECLVGGVLSGERSV